MTTDRKCFVIMPFASQFREVYDRIFRPVCESLGVHCWRVDEIAAPGSITRDIVDGILDADIVIADLTGRNANVFYELGIAHSTGNKTIMVAQSKDDVPFDVSAYRVVFYEQSISGAAKFSDSLRAAISELLSSLNRTNNPVQDVFSARSIGPVKRRQPLAEIVELSSLNKSLRDLISGENLIYVEDLTKIDLELLRERYSLGASNLENLVRMMLKGRVSIDQKFLQDFIMKYRLKLNRRRLNDPINPG